ncbi:MAG: membrane peptidoglycan carboxypeptidase [Verrucomicrobiales bacterium]|jgi:membrane peptidoglycan carboxypeptidase
MAKKKDKSLKIYKTPFWRRRWFHICLAGFFTLLIIGSIVLYSILKDPYERAQEFDLADLTKVEVPSTIYDRHGKEYSRIFVQDRRAVKITDVPLHFVNALMAAEDGRFQYHTGVDYKGVVRAVLLNIQAGEVTQGASTITQQLARQSFNLTERSLERKLIEAFLANRIEEEYSKDEILEFYLNRIYFGSGFWGINAASLGYFGKPITDVDVVEAATLCGLIKSPNRLSPLRNPDGARLSRNNVLLRMRTENMISDADYQRLKELPLVTAKERTGRRIGYVYEEIRQRVNELIPQETTASDGFKIFTTVDTALQATARESLKRYLAEAEKHPDYSTQGNQTYDDYVASLPTEDGAKIPPPKYLQGAMLMIDNKTGGVIAMVGGRDFQHSVYNRATLSRLAVGTSFLPLVYTAAFEKDFFPGSPLKDREIDNRFIGVGGATGILGEWGTESSENSYEGIIPAREALVKGKMAASARLGRKLGAEKVKDLAKRAGVDTDLQDLPRMFLGEDEIKLSELCLAYSMFPNGGSRAKELFVVERIENGAGKVVFERVQEPAVKVVDEITAYQTHSCLKEVLTRGTGQRAFGELGLLDKTAAGKTGTSYGFENLSFVGYNSEVTCAVWAGFDSAKTIYRGAFSNDVLLPAWTEVMNASLNVFSPTEIPIPDNVVTVEVCRRSGMRATDSCYEKVTTGTDQPTELLEGFDPGERYERSTYKEIIRRGIKFNNYCDYHSENPEIYVTAALPELLQDEQAAKNVIRPGAGVVAAVIPMAPTIIGDDPYNSIQSQLKAIPVGGIDTSNIQRAKPLAVIKIGSGSTAVELQEPEPIEFPELD